MLAEQERSVADAAMLALDSTLAKTLRLLRYAAVTLVAPDALILMPVIVNTPFDPTTVPVFVTGLSPFGVTVQLIVVPVGLEEALQPARRDVCRHRRVRPTVRPGVLADELHDRLAGGVRLRRRAEKPSCGVGHVVARDARDRTASVPPIRKYG